jgi:Methyltransferase domain
VAEGPFRKGRGVGGELVSTWDEAFADGYEEWSAHMTADIPFYTDLATQAVGHGPILELAVGNGRVAIPIAQATGQRITGVDSSPAMLAQARENARAEPHPGSVRRVLAGPAARHVQDQLPGRSLTARVARSDRSRWITSSTCVSSPAAPRHSPFRLCPQRILSANTPLTCAINSGGARKGGPFRAPAGSAGDYESLESTQARSFKKVLLMNPTSLSPWSMTKAYLVRSGPLTTVRGTL